MDNNETITINNTELTYFNGDWYFECKSFNKDIFYDCR